MIGKTPQYEARQRARQLLIGAAIAAGVFMAPAAAAPPVTAFGPVTGLGPEARLVTDDELGEMRGKFIEPESVRFFGIQLSSAWQTADGSVLTATLEFESSFNHGQPDPNTVSAAAEWNHACTGSCDPNVEIPNATQDVTVVFGAIGATGLTTVNGAVQSTQVSGHDNSVGNVMHVRIGDYNAASVGPPDADAVALTASKSVRFDDNFVVKFELTQNTVGLELRGPGPHPRSPVEACRSPGRRRGRGDAPVERRSSALPFLSTGADAPLRSLARAPRRGPTAVEIRVG